MGKALLLKKGLTMAALALFGVSAVWAGDATTSTNVVLDADFSVQTGTEGWKTVDKSTKEGTTWGWWQNSFSVGVSYVSAVRIARDWNALHNDYYVSPAVELKGGVTYTITSKTGKNNGGILKLEVGTSAEDMTTYSEVKTLSPISSGSPVTPEEITYTPTTDGTYYFAFHAIQETSGSDYMYLFGLKVEIPGEGGGSTEPDQPQTKAVIDVDFNEAEPTGWTALDANNDGTVWKYNAYAFFDYSEYKQYKGVQYMQGSYYDNVNDYYVSPAVELKAGVTYHVTTQAAHEYNDPNLTFEIGTSATDASTFKKVQELTVAKKYAEREQTFDMTVEQDGTYYLAYHVAQTDAMSRKTYLFGLKVEADEQETPGPDQPGGVETVYETDMAADPGWTFVNGNSGNSAWSYKAMAMYLGGKYVPGMQIMQSQWSDNVNDYCITPAMELKKGTYSVTTTTGHDYANVPTLSLELGTSNKDVAKFQTVAALNPTKDAAAVETNTINVAEDGTYYLAVRMHQTDAKMRKAFVLGIKVETAGSDTPDVPAVTPAAVADLAAAVDFDNSTVTLTWTNPTKDAEGNDLKEKAGARIYKNGELVETIDELEGETTTKVLSPEPFEGEVTFAVKTFIGEKESEEVSTVVDLTKPVITPAAVSDLAAAVDFDNSTVTLTWTNPTKDTEGNELKEKAGAKVYKNGELVETIDELTGETTTRVLSPEPFEGIVKFSVKAFIDERESGEVSTMVDLTKPVVPTAEPKDVPYTADLTSGDDAKDFTVINSNNDDTTWGTTDGISGVTYNSDNATAAANDWIVTPPMKLEEGKNYSISATFSRQGAFDPDKMEVYAGDEPTAAALTELVGTYDINDTEGLTNAMRYIAAQTGNKFFGFHIVTPAAENGQLSLLSVEVKTIEKATPTAVADLAGAVDSEAKTVTLTWTNPTKDTEGYAFVEKVGAKIYQDGNLVETIDELTGETTVKVLTPATFSGETFYSVQTFIGENYSEDKTVQVNLNDKTGKEVLVKKFTVDSSTKGEWTIVSGGGTGEWKYDYSDVFNFNYQRGGAVEDDWLITPAVALSHKDRFVLKYKLKTTRDYDASIEVTIGEGTDPQYQDQVLAQHMNLKQNGFADFQTEQFSVPYDGFYNVGFHVTEANYYLDVRGVELYSIGEPTEPDLTSISNVKNKVGFIAYNKANGSLLVPAGSSVVIYSANGAMAMQTVAGEDAISIDALAKGMYVLKVTDAEGNTTSQKIVK